MKMWHKVGLIGVGMLLAGVLLVGGGVALAQSPQSWLGWTDNSEMSTMHARMHDDAAMGDHEAMMSGNGGMADHHDEMMADPAAMAGMHAAMHDGAAMPEGCQAMMDDPEAMGQMMGMMHGEMTLEAMQAQMAALDLPPADQAECLAHMTEAHAGPTEETPERDQ